jgi:hypothetical protein
MNLPADTSATAVPRTLELELTMIQGAIDLVARGESPRVVLTGLRFGERLLVEARRLATAAGVHIVPIWTARSEGADLAVEAGLE